MKANTLPRNADSPLTFVAGDDGQGGGTVTFGPRVGGSTFFSVTSVLLFPLRVGFNWKHVQCESAWFPPRTHPEC